MIDNNPKVFISYCQQPEENKIKVMQLAERLSRDGVYVVIDEWDLQNGQDKNVFMEQMVNDETVDKVLLLYNKEYTEKADTRKGGVGIESTIISEELYSNLKETKFIPIVLQKKADGTAFMPIYAKSRIYIDLSEDDKYEEGYDNLLRDIYKKPKSQRPPIGRMPTYLNNQAPSFLPTAGYVDSIKKAILSDGKYIDVKIKNYKETFIQALINFRIDYHTLTNENFIQIIETQIEEMQALKNDFITFVNVIVNTEYCTGECFLDFFEQMLQSYEDNGIELLTDNGLHSLANDNYRFFNYDFFISVITVLFIHERYDIINTIVKYQFCIVRSSRDNLVTSQRYMRFREYVYTLDQHKNERFSLRRVSVTADLVKQYAIDLKFDDIVKIDILLYYLSAIYPGEGYLDSCWYPTLAIYNDKFEILPKLVSKRYFEKAKQLFGVASVQEFQELISNIQTKDIRDGYRRVPTIQRGLCLEKVGTLN